MSIKSIQEKSFIINIPDATETLDSILKYISVNINLWKDKDTLWDIRNFNFYHINHEIMETFADKALVITKSREGLKTAFVVKDDLAFGMIRMLQMLYNDKLHLNVNIFKNKKEAFEWLLKEE